MKNKGDRFKKNGRQSKLKYKKFTPKRNSKNSDGQRQTENLKLQPAV